MQNGHGGKFRKNYAVLLDDGKRTAEIGERS
jgi:hypothetical protein